MAHSSYRLVAAQRPTLLPFYTESSMPTSRRDFLQRAAGATALFSAMPLTMDAFDLRAMSVEKSQGSEKFDLSWINHLNTKHKAVFDVPEVDSGYGVWRASL
ncbi:MAG: twin-arginine translocation signal domain-containing protein, partial [Gemmatimonadaceae bacterium]